MGIHCTEFQQHWRLNNDYITGIRYNCILQNILSSLRMPCDFSGFVVSCFYHNISHLFWHLFQSIQRFFSQSFWRTFSIFTQFFLINYDAFLIFSHFFSPLNIFKISITYYNSMCYKIYIFLNYTCPPYLFGFWQKKPNFHII